MLTFKETISTIPALRFVYDNMNLCSSPGRKELLQSCFITDVNELQTCFDDLEKMMIWYKTEKKHLEKVKQLISSTQDIFGTLNRLKNNDTLDDVELFEIKKNALIMNELLQILHTTSFSIFQLFDVTEVIEILDPEKTRLPHFYIYSAYSKELTTMRNMVNKTADEDLLWQISKLENRIRENLTYRLFPFVSHLEHNLIHIAKLDILLAKTELAIKWNCCKPEISDTTTSFTGLVHPIVAQRLETENSKFQPIDITLKQESYLITGANMTGKSIFLRSVAFCQWMFQCGFYVPAQNAAIVPVEKIYFISGDSDTENTGLSSYVNEIFQIHKILQEMKAGVKMLVLADEFARTTNPHEGRALVTAFLEMMNHKNIICLVTTHYSNVEGTFRRLRVKGIRWDKVEQIKTNPRDLNKYIDYQLEDDKEKTAPKEAIQIAELLDIDNSFISLVKKYL